MPLRARRFVGLYFLAFVTAVLSSAWAEAPSFHRQPSHTRFTPRYSLRDKTFTAFVTDSYRQTDGGTAGAAEFYRWLDAAYGKTRITVGPPPGVSRSLPLAGALDAERSRLARISGSAAKTRQERQVAAWAHRTVKKAIPRFSLDRGFEFYSMVHGGERQCYAQSVLIAGMLQRAGIPAGVVMVWKNQSGATSNNGHAITIARLSNGRHLLIDASEPLPFSLQQGLFVRQDRQYRFVTPLFNKNDSEIFGYRRESDQERIAVSSVHALDLPFLKSQFYYYRGERAPGGAFDSKKTIAGLSRSAQHLQTAIRLCPENPLATYMLGRVYQRLGKTEAARQQFAQSYRLYSRFGYLPEGARDAFALVDKTPQAFQSAPEQ
jgi:tetratricopeptide (TPR) repeat protein